MKTILLDILFVCCEIFDVTVAEVQSPSRRQEASWCRKAFCQIASELYHPKDDTLAAVIGKTRRAVGLHLATQPSDRYYEACLMQIRSRVRACLKCP